jgi:prepilin-type N-terminal cleavage/methylation domain-containing protein
MSTRQPPQKGFTLVELMISLVLGLLITSAVTFMFISSKQSFRTQEGLSEVQESGRNTLRVLATTIRYAGYLPNPTQDTDPTQVYKGQQNLPVRGGLLGVPPIDLGIQNYQSGTDSLVISYYGNSDQAVRTCLGDSANDDATKAPTQVYVAFYLTPRITDTADPRYGLSSLNCYTARYASETTHQAMGAGGTCGVPANSIQSETNETSAGSCKVRSQPIIDGVSAFTVRYLVDTNGDGSAYQFMSADDVDSGGLARWRSVTAVQVNITIQSTQPVNGSNTTAGSRISRDYSTTIAIRNRLSAS